ncbi:MAG: hypothetical protein Q8M02_15785 [Candidatus Didemnitutus sp.]|nr:hypothetical protein [Candidatus Didemnitutus sp.]
MAALLLLGCLFGTLSGAVPITPNSSLTFNGVSYTERFSKGDHHQLTPRGQKVLEKRIDLLTIVHHRSVKTKEALASLAKEMLSEFAAQKAVMIKTATVPMTPSHPPEFLLVAALTKAELFEVIFTRLTLTNEGAVVVSFSHREKGRNAGHQMDAWMTKTAALTEHALLTWQEIPPPSSR